MSLRDDSFRKFLGREPSTTEWADIDALQHATGLNPNDASWGLFAFLVMPVFRDAVNREQIQVTLEALERFDRRLKDAIARLPDRASADSGAFWDALGAPGASSRPGRR
ncbi:MAG: hypothetical protein ACYDB1_00145 [Acidiferrobacteraceae bacterium]